MDEELQTRLAALEAENLALRARQEPSVSRPKSEITDTPAICRVAVKLPPLWPDRVTVWFAQAEAQFHLAGINTDETKYSHVLSQIDHKVAGEIEDIITDPPTEGKYQKLKDTLIKRFSPSEEQRVRQLLGENELGDRKPSQFLRHLRSLAGTALADDNVLRQLWLRRLPQHVQGILAAHADLPLEKVAELADKIIEAQPGPANVYAASASPLASMMERIEELGNQIAALSSTGNRSGASTTQQKSPRNTSPGRSDKRCWYHKTYGTKALKCIPPCNWKAENLTRSQ